MLRVAVFAHVVNYANNVVTHAKVIAQSKGYLKSIERLLSTKIQFDHFHESQYQFGPEATVALEEVRKFSTVSKNDLMHYLHYTINAVDQKILASKHFLKNTPQILLDVVGDHEQYSVQDNLDRLRKIKYPSAQQKLVIRTLSLISFDLLDPLDVENQQIQKIYNDLYLLDREIMPEPRRGGANGFRSMKLYQDDERRIRFHIYPAGEPENHYIGQDNLAHQHYGDSASIILAGNLVNQHFIATPTDNPEAELALYRVKPEFDPTIDPANAVRSTKTLTFHQGVNLTLISSHLYKAGDYYHLPKPISEEEAKTFPYALKESDRLDYHKVGNLGLTATLWSLKYPKKEMEYDFSVLPRNSPKELTVGYSQKNVDVNEFYSLLLETDSSIRKELFLKSRIQTMLARGKRNLFQQRAKFYLSNKVSPAALPSAAKTALITHKQNSVYLSHRSSDEHLVEGMLAVNVGSSSIKFSLFTKDEMGQDPKIYIEGRIDIGETNFTICIRNTIENINLSEEKFYYDGKSHSIYEVALTKTFEWIRKNLVNCKIIAVCHRVLHGADYFREHARITPDNIQKMEELCEIAPMHQPYNLTGIKLAYAFYPDIPQYACFDTVFHSSHSALERAISIAPQLTPIKLQNFGFHGLSYEYIVSQLHQYLDEEMAKGKVIIAHLGGGSTLCAVKEGKSIAATGGFSKLDGVMMATRSGSVDPGAILYLLKYMKAEELKSLLFYNSGLKGVSQHSQDVRVLFARNTADSNKAVGLYVQSISENIAKLATKLGGMDALVFTGGIGESSARIRKQVCERLKWLGVQLSNKENVVDNLTISDHSSRVPVFVIPTNENLQMVRHAIRLLQLEQQSTFTSRPQL